MAGTLLCVHVQTYFPQPYTSWHWRSGWFLAGLASFPAALLELYSDRERPSIKRALVVGALCGLVGLVGIFIAHVEHIYLTGSFEEGGSASAGLAALVRFWERTFAASSQRFLLSPPRSNDGEFIRLLERLGLNAIPFIPLSVGRLLRLGVARETLATVVVSGVLALPLCVALSRSMALVTVLSEDEPLLLVTPLLPALCWVADRFEARLRSRSREP
jgi:hypothetical protein